MTTDEIDRITAEERAQLVGNCVDCDEWSYFTRGQDEEKCKACGGKFNTQHGKQITTRRTFNPFTAKKKGKR